MKTTWRRDSTSPQSAAASSGRAAHRRSALSRVSGSRMVDCTRSPNACARETSAASRCRHSSRLTSHPIEPPAQTSGNTAIAAAASVRRVLSARTMSGKPEQHPNACVDGGGIDDRDGVRPFRYGLLCLGRADYADRRVGLSGEDEAVPAGVDLGDRLVRQLEVPLLHCRVLRPHFEYLDGSAGCPEERFAEDQLASEL